MGKRLQVHVTNSELGQFRSCRQRWHFKYEELLRPKVKPKPLTVGTTIHAGIAAMYRRIYTAQQARQAVSVDELCAVAHAAQKDKLQQSLVAYVDLLTDDTPQEEVDAIIQLSEEMEQESEDTVRRFVERFGDEDQRRYRIVAFERAFRVPLLDQNGTRRSLLWYEGVWDLLVYDEEVMDLVLGEHKTTSSDAQEYEHHLDLDPQTTGYIYAANQALEWDESLRQVARNLRGDGSMPNCNRVFYNVIRKKGPREPNWNKPDKHGNQKVSAAAVDTIRDIYEAALQRQESQGPGYVRSEKQAARLESLYGPTRYVARHETWHSPEMIERWREETHEDAKLVRDARAGRLPLSRNATICTGPWNRPCAFRSICILDSPERRQEFVKIDDRHAEVAEAIEEAEAEAGIRS